MKSCRRARWDPGGPQCTEQRGSVPRPTGQSSAIDAADSLRPRFTALGTRPCTCAFQSVPEHCLARGTVNNMLLKFPVSGHSRCGEHAASLCHTAVSRRPPDRHGSVPLDCPGHRLGVSLPPACSPTLRPGIDYLLTLQDGGRVLQCLFRQDPIGHVWLQLGHRPPGSGFRCHFRLHLLLEHKTAASSAPAVTAEPRSGLLAGGRSVHRPAARRSGRVGPPSGSGGPAFPKGSLQDAPRGWVWRNHWFTGLTQRLCPTFPGPHEPPQKQSQHLTSAPALSRGLRAVTP